MSMFDGFRVSLSGMDVQSKRLRLVASNLANAGSTRTPDGTVYRRKDILLGAAPLESKDGSWAGRSGAFQKVMELDVVEDPSPLKRLHMPGHPDADKDGFVLYPNVEPFEEMVHMMDAVRSYEANLATFNASKEMIKKALTIGR